MPVPSTSALYYPHIDIRNDRWLRNSVLFWDSIRTIVPEGIREPYSTDTGRALCDEGILVPIKVASRMEEIEDLTDSVLDFLTDPAATPLLLEQEGKGRIHPDKLSPFINDLVRLHPEKLPYMISDYFRSALREDGFYGVPAGFANFYMTLLAAKLAERLGLGLVTESQAADQFAVTVRRGRPLGTTDSGRHRRHGYFNASGLPRKLPHQLYPALLVDLAVQHIQLPPNLPLDQLLAFKRSHREELSVFRKEVTRLASDLPVDASIEAVRQAAHDQYQANVVPALRSLRHSLSAQGWDASLNGFLKVSFFSAGPTSAAILAGLPSSIALLAGVGVSLTATAVLLASQRKKTKIDSPYSYLLSLERKL